MMESLTNELVDKALGHHRRRKARGGMARLIETGEPKLRIEESAAKKQARIDRGEDVIVGVNKYRLAKEDAVEILEIDNSAVRESQIRRLNDAKARRDQAKTEAALAALTRWAETGEGNGLALAIDAACARATVGESAMLLKKYLVVSMPTPRRSAAFMEVPTTRTKTGLPSKPTSKH